MRVTRADITSKEVDVDGEKYKIVYAHNDTIVVARWTNYRFGGKARWQWYSIWKATSGKPVGPMGKKVIEVANDLQKTFA